MNSKTKITVQTLANLAAVSKRYARLTTSDMMRDYYNAQANAYIDSAKIVITHARIHHNYL